MVDPMTGTRSEMQTVRRPENWSTADVVVTSCGRAEWERVGGGSSVLLPELLLTFEASAGLEQGWRSKWSKRIQESLCERRKLEALALGARGPQFESGRPDQRVNSRSVLNSAGALALMLSRPGRGPGVHKQVLQCAAVVEASSLSPPHRQDSGVLRVLRSSPQAR